MAGLPSGSRSSTPAIKPRPRTGNLNFRIWNFGLQFVEQKFAEFRAAFAQFQPLDFRDLRQRHRAADRIAEKGAGMNRLAARRRPGGVHEVGAPDAGRQRKAAGERLAEADEIGHNAAVFAGKPFSGAAEAGVNFVENQQRADARRTVSGSSRQKFRRRNVDAAARLHRLDENRADPFAPQNNWRIWTIRRRRGRRLVAGNGTKWPNSRSCEWNGLRKKSRCVALSAP